MAVFLFLSPVFAAWLAYSSLQSAVDSFDTAQESLVSGEGDVEDLLSGAIDDANHGTELMADPLLVGLATITGTGDDLAAARRLGAIAGDASKLALDVWRELDELGGRLYADGRIDFDAVEELNDRMTGYGAELDALQDRLGEGDRGSLSQVGEAFAKAGKKLASAEEALATALRALEVLPSLFAEDSHRRYLVAFQSPSEARGGGGLLGVFGVLNVEDGRIELTDIHANEDLNELLDGREVDAPAWFDDLYGDLTALEDIRQANLSPSFPATARVMLEMYRTAYSETLDGVIAMDPIVLGKLTRPLGPLRAPGWSVTIMATNARRLLLRDIYKRFPRSLEPAQNLYLSKLIDAVWRKVTVGNFEFGSMGAALADSAATQHLKVFSTDPFVEQGLRDIGAAGDPTVDGPNVHLFFHNNFTGSKVDHYIERTHDIDIDLTKDGTAHVDASVEISNTVPLEPVGVINRPLNKKLPVGLARMTVHFMVPEGAEVTGTDIDGTDTSFFRGIDSGFPVRWSSLSISSGSSATVSIRYEIPDAIEPDGTFRFSLWPQALPFPDHFSVTVGTGGAPVIEHTFEEAKEGDFSSRGALKTVRTFEIRLDMS